MADAPRHQPPAFVIWTVALAVIFLRELEPVSVQLVIASVPVVAGAAVVGATA